VAYVLIADDDADIRLLLRLQLRALGHDVDDAAGGAEAMERIEARNPDVVLLDLRMPDVDGWEVLRRLRAAPDLATIPVVVVSAHADQADRAELRSLGATSILRKPVALERLNAALDEALAA